MRGTKKFHCFFFEALFLYKNTVCFTMVIKRSPGEESVTVAAVKFEIHP